MKPPCLTPWIVASALALLPAASPGQEPQAVIVSEFLAANDSGLRDEDGDTSDWIEITNRGPGPRDLSGWYLTDDAGNLRKWQFPDAPALVLEAGEYLVVFASGKDRTDPAELHTNFSLSKEGEFLALVEPDGVTVAQGFAPRYPPQRGDISYGMAAESATLVSLASTAETMVPSGPSPGPEWTGPDFDSGGSWNAAGTLGVGFQSDTGGGNPEGLLSYWSFDGNLEDPVSGNDGIFHGEAAPGFVAGFDGRPQGALQLDGVDDIVEVTRARGLPLYAHEAFSVALWVRGGPQADRRVFSEGSGSNNTPIFNLGTDHTGQSGRVDVYIRDAGGATPHQHTLSGREAFDNSWHHLAWVDDGGEAALFIDGMRDAVDFRYTRPALPLDRTSLGAILRATSSYHFGGAIDDVSLWTRALGDDEVTALASGTSALALGSRPYARFMGTDLEVEMAGVNASAYVRVPFEVEDPARFDLLTLEILYDDGFVAYINGVEAVRRNAPEDLRWNSAATSERILADALEAETIDLSARLGELHPGRNVLALHGLNADAADPDFLLVPVLRAEAVSALEPRYFRPPTPGAANGAGSADLTADTRFSVDRGFFSEPFLVEITCATEGAEIRYTLDGADVTPQTGTRYEGPIEIVTTTTLRAAAFKDGFEPSNIDTQTYIFPADVLRQQGPAGYPNSWGGATADYAMDGRIVDDPAYGGLLEQSLLAIPSLSLVLPVESIFGPSGIYSRPQESGRAWERRTSAELLDPAGGPGFQVDAGVRITGNRSRAPGNSPKHGLRLLFRGEYGATKLRFPLFGDSPVESFDTIVIKPNAFDSWVSDNSSQRQGAQYQRDQWVRDAQRETGHPTSHGFFVHLYINGLYWGVYNLGERPDASFAAQYFGGDKENWDAIKNHEEVVDGNIAAYRELDAIRATDLANPANYAAFLQYVDLDNLIDYMIVNMLGPATDWPGNYYMARERRPGAGFKFISWDAEYAFLGGVENNRTLPHWRDADSPTKFHHAARANLEYRVRFGDHLQRHFFGQGALTPQGVDRLWMERAEKLEPALLCESARWGDYRRTAPYRVDVEWLAEQESLRADYFPRRTSIVLEQFRDQGLYPDIEAPVFSRPGGDIPPGFRLEMSAPEGTILYTIDGGDPRLEGGAVSPEALEYTAGAGVVLPATARVLARARVGSSWSALAEALFAVDPGLRITEIMYHPAPPSAAETFERDEYEFIEIENTGAEAIELAGVRFARGIEFDFGASPVQQLLPGEVVVLVENERAFEERYGSWNARVAGRYGGKLRNDGEELQLLGPHGETLQRFTFRDAWHPETDGGGPSLVVVDPGAESGAWEDASGWRPSLFALGSPGLDESSGAGRGLQRPGDANQDGVVNISDAVSLLLRLFGGAAGGFPCGDGSTADPANVKLLDVNGDAGIDISDAVYGLRFLFVGGPPPVLGTRCVPMGGCPDSCTP